jgi:hypothetical protein
VGLGIVMSSDPALFQVRLLTPLDSLSQVQALRLGDMLLDPRTFRDQPLA